MNEPLNCTNWSHEDHMRFGAANGWWDEWDEIGPFKTIKFDLSEFSDKQFMSHVMVKAGQFSSVSEARNAGWNKPIEVGRHKLKKRRVIIEILGK